MPRPSSSQLWVCGDRGCGGGLAPGTLGKGSSRASGWPRGKVAELLQTACPALISSRYSSSMKSLSNKFVHLTNYSVNKKNTEYKSNSDETACQGHKW